MNDSIEKQNEKVFQLFCKDYTVLDTIWLK